jgi:hypothetical protein
MLDLFNYPKNNIIRSIKLPIVTGNNTRFVLLSNEILIYHENQWIVLDQKTLNVIDQFKVRNYSYKSISYSDDQGLLALINNEPLTSISPSVYQSRIAKLNVIDGSIDKFIDVSGFTQNEVLIDIASDNRYYYFLTDIQGNKQIKQYDLFTKQMFLLTDNLNNQVKFNRMKLENDKLLLLDSLENSIYEINKLNGRVVLFKRQFPESQIVDFTIKFNNLFSLSKFTDKLDQISLSLEFSHVALQTNVYELATNGVNQSLIRGTVFDEAEEFEPNQPLKVRILKPFDLITLYTNGDMGKVITQNTRGDEFIPFLEKTDEYLFMDPGSSWEFTLGNFIDLEQLRVRFAQFRPGDIRIELLTESGWQVLESTPVPLLLTREDIVFDNFFEKTTIKAAGLRIVNTTSNTLALVRAMFLVEDPNISEKEITNYAADTGQTLFFIASPKTTLNEILNPRFEQGRLYWEFEGRSELVDETLIVGDKGAFLHSIGDNEATSIKQKVILDQPTSRVITASLYVRPNITHINTAEKNCGLQLTITDIDNNTATYYQTFTTENSRYKRVKLEVIPPFPIYDVELKVICQKDTVGSIEVDKIQLEQDLLHDFVGHQIPNIFVKAIYEF